jgi:hypothetical protein
MQPQFGYPLHTYISMHLFETSVHSGGARIGREGASYCYSPLNLEALLKQMNSTYLRVT